MENEILKQQVMAASEAIWGQLDGYGTTETGWTFYGVMSQKGHVHTYEKQGVTVELRQIDPADWYSWKVAAKILKLASNP